MIPAWAMGVPLIANRSFISVGSSQLVGPGVNGVGFYVCPNIVLQAFGGCVRVREVEKELKSSTVHTGRVMSGCTQHSAVLLRS